MIGSHTVYVHNTTLNQDWIFTESIVIIIYCGMLSCYLGKVYAFCITSLK